MGHNYNHPKVLGSRVPGFSWQNFFKVLHLWYSKHIESKIHVQVCYWTAYLSFIVKTTDNKPVSKPVKLKIKGILYKQLILQQLYCIYVSVLHNFLKSSFLVSMTYDPSFLSDAVTDRLPYSVCISIQDSPV